MWHGSTGDKVGPVLSADAGLSVGLWTTANNAMAGDSRGVVSGLSDLAEIGKIVITITPAIRADVDVGGLHPCHDGAGPPARRIYRCAPT